MNVCGLCFDTIPHRAAIRDGRRLCRECRRYWDYLHSLSPADLAAERRIADAYTGNGDRA